MRPSREFATIEQELATKTRDFYNFLVGLTTGGIEIAGDPELKIVNVVGPNNQRHVALLGRKQQDTGQPFGLYAIDIAYYALMTQFREPKYLDPKHILRPREAIKGIVCIPNDRSIRVFDTETGLDITVTLYGHPVLNAGVVSSNQTGASETLKQTLDEGNFSFDMLFAALHWEKSSFSQSHTSI